MIDEPPDILWEGEIQAYCLDKKKIWKPRTKIMQGALIQTTPGSLKLELNVIFGKLVDKRNIPCNEDIDLSNITYAREKPGAKEFNFFCQCVKENEEGEEELSVHLFQTGTEEARQSWLQSVIEFMKRKVIYRPTCFFKVAVQKVNLEESVKLYGEYILRASKNEIEFMIAENIPGVKFSHEEVASIKLLQDTSLEGGKHVFDLIMSGSGTKRNQHIVVTAMCGFLLLSYLQRENTKLVEDILELRDFTQSISSLPMSPIHKRLPPVPPKPDEDKPPLPPREANQLRGVTLDYRKVRGSIDISEFGITPPLPPRNETPPNSPSLPPRNVDWSKKGMTLPRKMGLTSRISDLTPNTLPIPRNKIDIRDITGPQILPVAEISWRGARGLTDREPMPTPNDIILHPKPPRKLELSVEQQPIYNPKYIELQLGDRPREDIPSPEEHGYATVHFPESDSFSSMETPITELIEEIEFSQALTDDGGYLKLKSFDGNVDSGGYLTITDLRDSPTDPNSPLMPPKETQSPVVPPRTYRQFLKH